MSGGMPSRGPVAPVKDVTSGMWVPPTQAGARFRATAHAHSPASATVAQPSSTAAPAVGTPLLVEPNHVGALNEITQLHRLPTPRYSQPSRVSGSDHKPFFVVHVCVPGHDGCILYECEGREATVKLARQAAARGVLEQLGSQTHVLERSPPKVLPGWQLPDHDQPPLATAGRVIFIDLQNQQSAVRTFLARPTDFVVGFLSIRGTATVPFMEAPWPIMVVHSQSRDVVHASMCWELCKVLMGDGVRLPPAPPLEIIVVSRNLFTEALRDVVRLDLETSARAHVVHIEDSADVPQ